MAVCVVVPQQHTSASTALPLVNARLLQWLHAALHAGYSPCTHLRRAQLGIDANLFTSHR
jgi:hypothetical protein